MKTARFSLLLALIAGLLALAPLSLSAQDAEEAAITERMLERLEQIDTLKLSGKVGENNVGLLEQRAQLTPVETRLMNAENADRRALYTLIGRRVGLTLTVVGQGRAEEIRRRSAPGVWLQNREGRWYQKEE